MSAAELCLAWSPDDDDGFGKIFATAKSGPFSGQGSAWFDRTTVKENFVAALRHFPLSATAPPIIESGFWSKEKPRTLSQCHLRVVVSPYNKRGALLVRVDLATESGKTPDVDVQHAVTVRFLTEYAAIARFADDLDNVLDGAARQASIASTTT
jgi:hypothetical protein